MSELKVRTPNSYIRFGCPICSASSLCDIHHMSITKPLGTDYLDTNSYFLVCRACGQGSIWKMFDRVNNYHYDLRLVDPIVSDTPQAHPDMPKDIKTDYEEARLVASDSSRAAAALLRLALQKLCIHFGEPGKHLDMISVP